jgi:hypothetical protein
MKRLIMLPVLAASLLGGCVYSDYAYRGGGPGDYYYGRPGVDYRYNGGYYGGYYGGYGYYPYGGAYFNYGYPGYYPYPRSYYYPYRPYRPYYPYYPGHGGHGGHGGYGGYGDHGGYGGHGGHDGHGGNGDHGNWQGGNRPPPWRNPGGSANNNGPRPGTPNAGPPRPSSPPRPMPEARRESGSATGQMMQRASQARRRSEPAQQAP